MAPGVPVETMTNFSPPEYLNLENSAMVRAKLGIAPDRFVISYIGTLGLANHLEYLVDALAALPADAPVSCVIMGDGARKKDLVRYAENKTNADIRFLPHGNQKEVEQVLGICQAIYVSFANVPVLWTGSPNKFFDGLSAGKIIVVNFGEWLKDLIEKEGLGFYYPPDQPLEFARRLSELLNHREKTETIRHKGSKLAEKKYSPAIQVNILERFLNETGR